MKTVREIKRQIFRQSSSQSRRPFFKRLSIVALFGVIFSCAVALAGPSEDYAQIHDPKLREQFVLNYVDANLNGPSFQQPALAEVANMIIAEAHLAGKTDGL